MAHGVPQRTGRRHPPVKLRVCTTSNRLGMVRSQIVALFHRCLDVGGTQLQSAASAGAYARAHAQLCVTGAGHSRRTVAASRLPLTLLLGLPASPLCLGVRLSSPLPRLAGAMAA